MPTKSKTVRLKAVQGMAFFTTGGATVKNRAGKARQRVCLIAKARTPRGLLARAARILVGKGLASGSVLRVKGAGQGKPGKAWLQYRGKRQLLAPAKAKGNQSGKAAKAKKAKRPGK